MNSSARWPAIVNGTWLFGLVGLPLIALVWTAYGETTTIKIAGGTSLDFASIQQYILLGRSITLALVTAFVSTAMGIFGGYTVAKLPRHYQQICGWTMALPLLIPPFVHALAWILAANLVGVALHGFWTTVGVLSLSYWPIAGLLVWIGVTRSEGAFIEAARLGQRPWRVFWGIELGLIRPYWLTAFLLIFLLAFAEYGVPSFLRVNTYPVLVFAQFAAFYSLRGAMLMSWPYLVIPAIALMLWQRAVAPRLMEALTSANPRRRALPAVAGRWLGVPAWTGLMLLSLVLPTAILLRTAGAFQTYLEAWQAAHQQVWTSVGLAASAATMMTLLGLLLTTGQRHRRGWIQVIQDYGAMLPLAVPGTIYGLALIYLWNRPQTQWVYGSVFIILLLYTTRFLPFCAHTQFLGLAQISPHYWQAAQLMDTSQWYRLRRILLPLLAPAIAIGWGLGFLFSLHELAGTLLVSPPGVETLSVRIYSLYHYGAGRFVAALCVFLIIGCGLAMLVVISLSRWLGRPGRFGLKPQG